MSFCMRSILTLHEIVCAEDEVVRISQYYILVLLIHDSIYKAADTLSGK